MLDLDQAFSNATLEIGVGQAKGDAQFGRKVALGSVGPAVALLPPYTIADEEIELITTTIADAIGAVFT